MTTPETPDTLRFAVKGMDCAACVTKIERAVSRLDGVTAVKVGLQTETLTVGVADPAQSPTIEKAVTALGYQIRPLGAEGGSSVRQGEAHDHDHHDHDHHDHEGDSDHGQPIEGAWWRSTKGVLVAATGLLIAAAYLTSLIWPKASPLMFYVACLAGTWPVARRAFMALRSGSVFTIEMLMTIAVIGALWLGEVAEAALVVFLFAIGELLEGIAAGRARSGIKALSQIAPATAVVETNGGTVEMPVGDITVGSIIVVRPGDRVAADGVIIAGASAVDESALTGESVPRAKCVGDTVFAGSINAEAVLRVRIEKPAADNLIARVVRLVEEAADSKAPSERFIDQFAKWYMPAICLVAVATALLPPLAAGAPWPVWIYRALTLLLIGCPCALVISTPASIASALAAGARRGLLVKGGGVLEAIGGVKHIAFDKTGTLTEGKPKVTDVVPLGTLTANELLRIAAAAEAGSSHPLAVAIVAHAKAANIAFAPSASEVLPGKGLSAEVDGRRVVIGAPARLGVSDTAVLGRASALEAEGKSVSVVIIDGVPAGLIALRDEPREDAAEGLRRIIALGLRPIMLTGDNRANAKAVGQSLGIEVRSELLPEDKLAFIRARATDGGIAKVGDGINDAPALAAATVGIAMGSGTDVALEAADAAVLNNRISDVAALISLSRRTKTVIWQNVALALGLKAVFLITTLLGVTGLWIAILADTGATVLVTINALRLLRTKL
ncbi:heavy metal translocating P-type ATPase [Aestuariivirga sp.]|uniref:heavy metal translocating P-type ATPase n=1 Tax=Aestuariivirga sp. TaxID=2650926 RepID=UPI0039E2B36A